MQFFSIEYNESVEYNESDPADRSTVEAQLYLTWMGEYNNFV